MSNPSAIQPKEGSIQNMLAAMANNATRASTAGADPSFPSNPNARSINFALFLVLFAMTNTFDNGLFKKQKQLADYLSAQGALTGAMTTFLTLISNMEGLDGSGPGALKQWTTDMQGFQAMWSQVFGNDATFDSNGNVQPDPNSLLGQYITLMHEQNDQPGNPYDITQDPIYQQFNQLAQFMNTTKVSGYIWTAGDPTWQPYSDKETLLQIILDPLSSDHYETIVTMIYNHWLNNNPDAGHLNNDDYLETLLTNGSSTIQTASGLTTESYATMNQNNNSIQTIYQVLQSAITQSTDAIMMSLKLNRK